MRLYYGGSVVYQAASDEVLLKSLILVISDRCILEPIHARAACHCNHLICLN